MKNLTPDEAIRLEYRDVIHDEKHNNWRVNGRPQIWKRSGEFRVPLKCGMYAYGDITDKNAHRFHLPSECGDEHPGDAMKAAIAVAASEERIRRAAQERYLRRFISK